MGAGFLQIYCLSEAAEIPTLTWYFVLLYGVERKGYYSVYGYDFMKCLREG